MPKPKSDGLCVVKDQFCESTVVLKCSKCGEGACDACNVQGVCHTCLRSMGGEAVARAHNDVTGGMPVRRARAPWSRGRHV